MKANRRNLSRILRTALRLSLMTALGSCAAPPPPAPVATTPAPIAVTPLPRPALHWRDTPITPGDWQWSNTGGISSARFAGGAFELRCDRANGMVVLLRAGSASGPVAMGIATTTQRRTVSAQPYSGPPATLGASLAAHDDLLDAMAFSRGRFAVEVQGLAPLYIPSWPEVSRVLEDCR